MRDVLLGPLDQVDVPREPSDYGMLFGAYAGSLIALPIPSRNLQGLFGCFLLLAGFLLWRKTQIDTSVAGSGQENVRA